MLQFIRKTALWVLLLPIASFGIGVASNQLVIVANNGKFPVRYTETRKAEWYARQELAIAKIAHEVDTSDEESVADAQANIYVLQTAEKEGMIDSVHCIMTDKTHLNLLGDIFDFDVAIFSIGDGLLYAGLLSFEYCALLWLFLLCSKALRQKN